MGHHSRPCQSRSVPHRIRTWAKGPRYLKASRTNTEYNMTMSAFEWIELIETQSMFIAHINDRAYDIAQCNRFPARSSSVSYWAKDDRNVLRTTFSTIFLKNKTTIVKEQM